MFAPPCDWKAPSLSDLPGWKGVERVCLDVETFDPNLFDTGPSVRTGGHLCGIAVGLDYGEGKEKGFYLPFAHQEGDNLPQENVLRYIRDQCNFYDGFIVGANLSYDLDWLWEEDIMMPMVKGFKDVLIAEPLIDENKYSYSLDRVATTWLGKQKDKTMMKEAARSYGWNGKARSLGEWINVLPGRYVGAYGEGDAILPLQVLRKQEAEIKRQEIEQVWQLESDLLPALVRMKRRGVKVDEDALIEIETLCFKKRVAAAKALTEASGVRIGPEDSLQKETLAKAFRATGLDIDVEDSMDKGFIAQNIENPAVAALKELRKWDTLRKLSIDPVKEHLVNGRIHCSFNQLAMEKEGGNGKTKGARYGRLSAEHVNMQQQPARDEEIGPMWRSIYLPDGDGLWAACDYSQQEPRILVHWAETMQRLHRDGVRGLKDYPMNGADTMGGQYRSDPDADSHQMMADLAGVVRKEAKTLFLGLTYGMGNEKLCNDLGLPTKIITIQRGPNKGGKRVVAGQEAERILSRFYRKLPFLRDMENLLKERANQNGFVKTLSGRRCRFPHQQNGVGFDWTYRALNRLVQGSAADQTKAAVVAADREGIPLQLQVHDELDLTVANPSDAHILAEIMEQAMVLTVPSKVDVEIGKSWGDSMS